MSLADPGFPRLGRQSQMGRGGNLLVSKVFLKTALKRKKLCREEAAPPQYPLDPPMYAMYGQFSRNIPCKREHKLSGALPNYYLATYLPKIE